MLGDLYAEVIYIYSFSLLRYFLCFCRYDLGLRVVPSLNFSKKSEVIIFSQCCPLMSVSSHSCALCIRSSLTFMTVLNTLTWLTLSDALYCFSFLSAFLPRYIASQYLADSSLGDEVSQYDFTKGSQVG